MSIITWATKNTYHRNHKKSKESQLRPQREIRYFGQAGPHKVPQWQSGHLYLRCIGNQAIDEVYSRGHHGFNCPNGLRGRVCLYQ